MNPTRKNHHIKENENISNICTNRNTEAKSGIPKISTRSRGKIGRLAILRPETYSLAIEEEREINLERESVTMRLKEKRGARHTERARSNRNHKRGLLKGQNREKEKGRVL
uniref:Uncharacterized protein n=1 Tax=Rhizophora mucronata TaxID=61149 RepID=A0A2P2MIE7_RHIMU